MFLSLLSFFVSTDLDYFFDFFISNIEIFGKNLCLGIRSRDLLHGKPRSTDKLIRELYRWFAFYPAPDNATSDGCFQLFATLEFRENDASLSRSANIDNDNNGCSFTQKGS